MFRKWRAQMKLHSRVHREITWHSESTEWLGRYHALRHAGHLSQICLFADQLFRLMAEQYESDNFSYLASLNKKKNCSLRQHDKKFEAKDLHRKADEVWIIITNIHYTFFIKTTHKRHFRNCFLLQPNLNQPQTRQSSINSNTVTQCSWKITW